jgi:hypothetical protein
LVRAALQYRDERSYTPEETALWDRYAEAAKNTYIAAYALSATEERAAGRTAEFSAGKDEREPLTRAAIARDSWNAVTLDIPEDASRELLSLISATARDLRHSMAARGNGAVREDDAAEFFDLSGEAKDRQQDADTRLAALELAAEQNQARAEFRESVAGEMLHNWRYGFEGEELPELSPGWIDADPWRAVTAPLPADASADFLSLVADTAGELKAEAGRRGAWAADADDVTDWRHIAEEAGRRLQHVEERLETMRSVERTSETDQRELIGILGEAAYRAVNGPIPRDGDAESLARLSDDVDHVLDGLDGLLRGLHATTISPGYIREQFDKARDRLNEVEMRLELLDDAAAVERDEERLAELDEFTRDDVVGNPWAIVEKDIPRDADAAMLMQARDAVAGCVGALEWEIQQGNARDDPAYFPGYVDARLDKATARLAALDARLEAVRTAGFVPGQEPMRSTMPEAYAEFLSGDFVESRLAEHTDRVMSLVLNVLERGGADEPQRPLEQLVENTGAGRSEGGMLEAARVGVNLEKERSGVDAGAGDDAVRSDPVYERYAGLTRDDAEPERDRDDGRSR